MSLLTRRSEAAPATDYCTIREVAERLRVSPKRVRNMMAAGVLVEGRHFFRRAGIGPRFRWSRIVEWLESGAENPAAIPMARSRRRLVRGAPTVYTMGNNGL